MKKIILLLTATVVTASLWGQAPQKMSYQAVIRNASNALVVNTTIGMRISILQGSAAGAAVYVETQTTTTNINGLATIEVGGGTVVTGTFAAINWSTGLYWIKTETDPAGGTAYSIQATNQLLSVPFALHAASASGTGWATKGNDINNTNTGNVGIGTTTPAASAQLDISSTDKGFLPPRMTAAARDAIVSPANGLVVYCIDCGGGQLNVFNYSSDSWTNMIGGAAAAVTPLVIGQNYGGGKIAYILEPGDPGYDAGIQHGLIAALADQGTAPWGCALTGIPGAHVGGAIGTGNQNTIAIMAGCNEAGIAARICGDLVLGGYSDWYLPNLLELSKLYINRVAIGGFVNGAYWTSSEWDFHTAYYQEFNTGIHSFLVKYSEVYVRAVRYF